MLFGARSRFEPENRERGSVSASFAPPLLLLIIYCVPGKTANARALPSQFAGEREVDRTKGLQNPQPGRKLQIADDLSAKPQNEFQNDRIAVQVDGEIE